MSGGDLFRHNDDPGIGVPALGRRAARRGIPSSPREAHPSVVMVGKESDAALIEWAARVAEVDGIPLDRPIRPRPKRPLIWHVGQALGAVAIAGLALIALLALPGCDSDPCPRPEETAKAFQSCVAQIQRGDGGAWCGRIAYRQYCE